MVVFSSVLCEMEAVIPLLQMRKVRHREIKSLARDRTFQVVEQGFKPRSAGAVSALPHHGHCLSARET